MLVTVNNILNIFPVRMFLNSWLLKYLLAANNKCRDKKVVQKDYYFFYFPNKIKFTFPSLDVDAVLEPTINLL